LTYLFPSIRLNKQIIEVEFSGTFKIPEFSDLGEFTYSKHEQQLQNEIVIPFWKDFKIDLDKEDYAFELNFDSDDKKIYDQQTEAYKILCDYSSNDWQIILNPIWMYYKQYYSDLEELKVLNIENGNDFRESIELNSVYIHRSGAVGLSFNCTWDEEHGLGVRLDKNNVIKVGESSEA